MTHYYWSIVLVVSRSRGREFDLIRVASQRDTRSLQDLPFPPRFSVIALTPQSIITVWSMMWWLWSYACRCNVEWCSCSLLPRFDGWLIAWRSLFIGAYDFLTLVTHRIERVSTICQSHGMRSSVTVFSICERLILFRTRVFDTMELWHTYIDISWNKEHILLSPYYLCLLILN